MATNRKVKLSVSNFDNKDLDSFFRDVDKYFDKLDSDIENSIDKAFREKYNISVEITDKNTPPKNLCFKKYIKWLKNH